MSEGLVEKKTDVNMDLWGESIKNMKPFPMIYEIDRRLNEIGHQISRDIRKIDMKISDVIERLDIIEDEKELS